MVIDKKKKNTAKSPKFYIGKRQNKNKERNSPSKLPKIVLKLFLFIIFCNSISLSHEKPFKLRKLEILSNITMVIRGNGTKKILGEQFNILPLEVYIDGNKQDNINKTYSLLNEENKITLIFDRNITNCFYMFSNLTDVIEIDLSNFDSSRITDMTGMFYGCHNLKKINFTNFDTSSVLTMEKLFHDCKYLNSINLLYFNTSKVTTMNNMFYGCNSLKSLDLSNFNTSSVTNMNSMFFNCNNLTNLDISKFDTSKVSYMSSIFRGCSSLLSLNLTSLDTSNVKDMSNMFYNCYNLSSINLSSFKTSNVNDMGSMFSGCSLLTSLDLSNFNTSNVKNMQYMFYNCKKLKTINISSFDTSEVSYMSLMFYGCSSLISVDLSNFDTSKVSNMQFMFYGCSSLISLDLSNFDTSKVSNMQFMFYECSSLISLDLSNFDTSKVSYMSYLFSYCNKLETLNISSFNTSLVSSMSSMFCGCSLLTSLDLSNFDTSNVQNMQYMFYNCKKLESINISSFYTSQVSNMDSMFYGCSSLSSLDLYNFDTSKVSYMSYMFSYCNKLETINISNFNTSKTESMGFMFRECSSLSSLDLSNFDTSKVKDMNYMFYSCSSLESLNISSFETSLVTNMGNMFRNCQKISYLDLSHFNTQKVKYMESLFYNCKNLKSLNLSGFNTSLVEKMDKMFFGCENLLYLDLSDFKINQDTSKNNMFADCKSLVYLNFFQADSNINFQKLFSNLNSIYCSNNINLINSIYSNIILNCSDICFEENGKVIVEEKNNVENCELFDKYEYELNEICYQNCPGSLITCENCFNKSKYCLGMVNEKNSNCKECFTRNILLKDFNRNNCYKECPYYYYFDENGNFTCTNTSECPNGYNIFNKTEKKCVKDSVIEIDTTYIATYTTIYNQIITNINTSTFSEENNSDFNKNEETTNIDFIRESTDINYIEETTIKEIKASIITEKEQDKEISKKDEEMKNFKKDMLNNQKVLDNAKKGEDYVKKEDDILYQVTTSDNQKNNTNKSISSIDLKDCEDILRAKYNDIPKNMPLIIIKIDYYSKDTKIPIIGYEIYHPVTKEKLDLSCCEDIFIQLNIPVNIDEENLFKYDPNSEYYTDNCFSYTTDDGTDILLSDRKKEYGDNNMSLCENNCNYNGYNPDDKQSICDCHVKNKIDLVSEIVNNTQKLSNSFSSEESSSGGSNIITMKCTKVLFTKDGLKNNISSYVLSVSMVYYLLSILLFIKCGYRLLVNDINDIISSKKQNSSQDQIQTIFKRRKSSNIPQMISENNMTNAIDDNAPPKKSKIKFGKSLDVSRNINSNSKLKLNNINNNKKGLLTNDKKNNLKKRNKPIKNKKMLIKNKIKDNILKRRSYPKPNKKIFTNKITNNIVNNITNNMPNPTTVKNVPVNTNPIKYNDFELNTMDYLNAINNDKRTCCQYYIALIRIKHPLLFAFCPIKDYNTMIIKLCIFLLSFDIYYVVNFAFFNENVIHKIYEDGGSFDIIYFIPQISISFGIANTITIIIKLIFLTERNIIQVRNQPSYTAAIEISSKVKKNIVIKHILFYISGIIFLFFFWILLSSFGAVYQNSQLILFEMVLLSFSISFIYPFFYNIIPCIFRFCSLNSEQKNMDCIYNFSKFLQIL